MKINSIYDIRQLLLRYHSVIYTRDPNADIILMEEELAMLKEAGLLEAKDYYACKLVLQAEQRRLEQNDQG
ncbi:YqgQ family protein [Salicibibacter kimchii]|uniref:DUF910 family protein n=1 Tax=Salicibibacter kimchii TaxID=2099786 RepID=A0A345BUV0_9BACI|nr:YqgQ family protein [Salicibibacter kimchii]AXF54731.1 DUF910 family protein [Salicibibacter kimchii]